MGAETPKKTRKREISEHSSSSGSDTPRGVNVVTPDVSERRQRQRQHERRMEAKIVKLIMSRRQTYSDSDEVDDREFGSEIPSITRRLFEDSDESEEDDILSIEETPDWASSVDSLANMHGWWWSCPVVRIADNGFLQAVVGSDPKDLNRFLRWSKWANKTVHVPAPSTPVSEKIRSVMWCLVQNDLGSLKQMFFALRSELLKALTTPFGGFRRTLLHAIAMHAQVDGICYILRLIEHQNSTASYADCFGNTPLHLLSLNSSLAKSDSITILGRFLKPEITQTRESTTSCLPVHMFVLSDHSRMPPQELYLTIKLLTPFSLVLKSRAFTEKRTPLMLACSKPLAVHSRDLVDHLAKLSSQDTLITDASGYTVLHVACADGRHDLIPLLVEAMPVRSRMQRCKLQGSTPIHVAAAGGTPSHAACIRTLMEVVPSSEILASLKDQQGWPPLLYALFADSLDTARACIEADSVLRDPTWGEAPQLVFALHLARRQDARLAETDEGCMRIKKLLSLLVSVPEFFSFVNRFISKDVSRLAGALGFILEIHGGQRLLSIENKVSFLHFRASAYTRTKSVPPTCSVRIPRPPAGVERIRWLADIGAHLRGKDYILGQRLAVTFNSDIEGLRAEEGYGIGPTREFFSLVGKVITDILLTASPDGRQLLPSNDPFSGDAHRTAGQLVAIAFLSAARMDLSRISPLLWRFLLEDEIAYEPDVEKLALWDPDLARSFKWLLETGGAESSEYLALVIEDSDKHDKYQYIHSEVVRRIRPCNMSEFRKGFFSVFEESWIVDFFDVNELAIVFGSSGSVALNVSEWRSATHYIAYSDSDEIIGWFWDLVASLPNEEKQLLLLFVTGMSSIPIGGFAAMTTMGAALMPFTISRVECGSTHPLPTAATCFNMIKLPAYPSREILNQRLLTAIRFGSQGFSFG